MNFIGPISGALKYCNNIFGIGNTVGGCTSLIYGWKTWKKNTHPYKFAKILPIMSTSYNISINNYCNQTWKFGDKISLNEGLEAEK